MMSVENIREIVVSCIVSAGGIGGIILAIVRLSSKQIADRLAVKYQNELEKEMIMYKNAFEKELSQYKNKLDHKEYISKTRFDTEFAIYKELNKVFMKLVKSISIMIPSGFHYVPANEEDKIEYEKNCYEEANNACVDAQDILYGDSAFIPQGFFDLYNEILKLSRLQLFAYEEKFDVLNKRNKATYTAEEYRRTGEINKKWETLNDSIRNYLSNLEVI